MLQGSFLEAVKAYLHRLSQPALSQVEDAGQVDPVWARNLLLQTLERHERAEGGSAASTQAISNQLEEWRAGDRIVVFVRELMRLLRGSFAADLDDTQVKACVELGLARWFHLPGELESRVRTLELDRLVREAYRLAGQSSRVFVGLDIVRYAAANQLAVRRTGRPQVSPLGQVLLNLEGRDAVRWLLQVEAHLALGDQDPERLSHGAAAALLAAGSWNPSEEGDPPCHPRTLDRLSHLGLLATEADDETNWPPDLKVTPLGKLLLGELAQGTPTPLALLAESLCGDLLSSTLHAAGAGQTELRSSAAEATASQARLVAHEIRNALLPVQAALDSLYREVQVQPSPEVLRRRRPVIDGGLRGALRFTERLLRTAELGAKPAERFEPVQAIHDALPGLSGAAQIEFSVASAGGSIPLLLGRREQFTLAVRNLLENALQHGGPSLKCIVMEIQYQPGSKAVSLTIDDDGQGVAAAERDHIFEEGVSNKPGGTGLGLSLVKRVVHDQMAGVVTCQASPRGGARFVLQFPVAIPSSSGPAQEST